MASKITKAIVERLTVNETGTRVLVFDSVLAGFGVRATPSAKTFFVQYRVGTGRTARKRRFSIGQFGKITVEQARKLAKKRLAEVTHGADPAAERNASRAAPTMAILGVEFLDDVVARRKATTAREYRRLWKNHVLPTLASRRVADIVPSDVGKLHHSMRPTPYSANRVLALLGSFFAFAERQGVRPKHSNPAHEIKPYKEKSRERFLTAVEVARLGEALVRAEREGLPVPEELKARERGMSAKRRAKLTGRKRGPYKLATDTVKSRKPSNPFTVAAIRFLLLTGWREREALTLRWADVNLERGTATLQETKTGKSERFIGAPARVLLAELPRDSASPFVFPGRDGSKPLVEINRTWYAVRHAAGLNDVRLHDLRHSFAAAIASSGGSLLLIAKLLGHRDTKTTAKYSHLLDDPIREAADRTSTTLDGWLGQRAGKVEVPLASRRSGKT